MTTELEQEFFKVFGIEPKKQGYCDWQSDCPYSDIKCGDDCPYWKYENELKYPEITDRILLKLICCVPKTVLNNCVTIKEIKEAVLKDLIFCVRKYTAQELKHQIQQLFKEEE